MLLCLVQKKGREYPKLLLSRGARSATHFMKWSGGINNILNFQKDSVWLPIVTILKKFGKKYPNH